jgi:hypothetical protein
MWSTLIYKKYWKIKHVISFLQNNFFYYVTLNSNVIYGRSVIDLGFHQQNDKSVFVLMYIACNPINHVANQT